MIYCVVPKPLADELYPKLVEHYRDDDNVTVIVERREFDRRARSGRSSASAPRRRAPHRSAIAAARASPATRCRSPRPSSRDRPPAPAAGVKVIVHVDGGARGNPGPRPPPP